MYMPRVRNPEKALSKAFENFEESPMLALDKLQRLGKQEGYQFVEFTLQLLTELHPEQRNRLVFLRAPEWHWRLSKTNPDKYFFGFIEEGDFHPEGTYLENGGKPGIPHVTPQTLEDVQEEDIGGPTSFYKTHSTRLKIYKKGKGKYFIVRVGYVRDLLALGLSEESITLTKGQGYLKRHQAYTVISGPIEVVEDARTERNRHLY